MKHGLGRNECPADCLDHPNMQLLKYWPSHFVTKVYGSRMDCHSLPTVGIQQILADLQRRMLKNNTDARKFLHSRKTAYRNLHHTCDIAYHNLHSQGIGTEDQHPHTFLKKSSAAHGSPEIWLFNCAFLLETIFSSLPTAVCYMKLRPHCFTGKSLNIFINILHVIRGNY